MRSGTLPASQSLPASSTSHGDSVPLPGLGVPVLHSMKENAVDLSTLTRADLVGQLLAPLAEFDRRADGR